LIRGETAFNITADKHSVRCEKVKNYDWQIVGDVKTCFMVEDTDISFPDTSLSEALDKAVGGLDFFNNKKIKFLPIRINLVFPNLSGYDAKYCSLTTITKENFKGLKQLRVIWLFDNEISFLNADVFDDLEKLEIIGLSNIPTYIVME